MGAIYIQSGVCVLSDSSEHQRQLRLIQAEVLRFGGEATVFETSALDARQEALVIERFKCDRDDEYEEFLDKYEKALFIAASPQEGNPPDSADSKVSDGVSFHAPLAAWR